MIEPSLGCRNFTKPVTSNPIFLEDPDISLGSCGGPAAHGSPKLFSSSTLLLYIPLLHPLPELGQHYPPLSLSGHSGSLGKLLDHSGSEGSRAGVSDGTKGNVHGFGGDNGRYRATPQAWVHREPMHFLQLPLGSLDSCPLSWPSCTNW